MNTSALLSKKSFGFSLSLSELKANLSRIREQILICVAEAKHYVKHVELLNEKVKDLSVEEEKLLMLIEEATAVKH
jgi:hypothetical protein